MAQVEIMAFGKRLVKAYWSALDQAGSATDGEARLRALVGAAWSTVGASALAVHHGWCAHGGDDATDESLRGVA